MYDMTVKKQIFVSSTENKFLPSTEIEDTTIIQGP